MWKKIMPMQKDIAKEIRNYVGAQAIGSLEIGRASCRERV